MKQNFIAIVLGVVAIVIAAAGSLGLLSGSSKLGNTTQSFWDAKLGYYVNGSAIFDSLGRLTGNTQGTCYILAYATTIAASTTAAVDCQGTAAIGTTNTTNATALTGVTSASRIPGINMATSTAKSAGTYGSIEIVGASASTTSGFITLIVQNNTGTTFTWPTTGTATGTVYYLQTR